MKRGGIAAVAELTSQALVAVAGLALMGLMALTFVDVMGRKFWVSVPGAVEISEILMVVVLFAGLPLVAWHAEHVGFEMVDKIYVGRAARWSRVGMDLFCFVAFGGLAWASWGFAGRTLDDAEITEFLKWPVAWFIYLMAVLIGVAALMHLLRAFSLDLEDEPADEEQHQPGLTA